jgi:hypothetical protein
LVGGYPHRVWSDAKGRDVIEEYSITGLGHGTPLDMQDSDHGENAAPFMLDAGISSTRLIATFWGIVPDHPFVGRPKKPLADQPVRPPAAYSSGAIQTTIEDALRSAGLLR